MIAVSIIIPIYNMEQYLEECLESILKQSLKNIEVICINDGSTDKTMEILLRYQEMFNNFVLISQDNIGVGRSRNRGITLAKGKYIAFMDPDDYYYSEDALECLYFNAEKYKVPVCGGSICVNKNGVITDNSYNIGTFINFTEDGIKHFHEINRTGGYYCYIYLRNFIIREKILFPDYIRYQDTVFFLQALVKAKEIYTMSKIIYCYRKGHKQIFFTLPKVIGCLRAVQDLLDITRENQWVAMHEYVIKQQLHGELSIATYQFFARGHTELSEYINKINKSIDSDLLQANEREKQDLYMIEPKNIEEYLNGLEIKEAILISKTLNYNEIIIFGAGFVGKRFLDYIQSKDEFKDKKICFAVSVKSGNPDRIHEKEVCCIRDIVPDDSKLVIIAALAIRHEDMINTLKEYKFFNYLVVDYQEFSLYGIKHRHNKYMEMM